MTIEELFERLATGELSQHAIGKGGSISESDYPGLLVKLNQGLTKLHTEFPLSEKQVMIQQYDDLYYYTLTYDYASSNADSTATYQYIVDSDEDPFLEDIIRIESAYDQNGIEHPLNDENSRASWFTPGYNQLQVPNPQADNSCVLLYRANHAMFDTSSADTSQEIYIPPSLEDALAAFIAYRCFISLGNASAAGLAKFFKGEYNAEVARIKRENLLQTTDGDSNIKLALKGFV